MARGSLPSVLSERGVEADISYDNVFPSVSLSQSEMTRFSITFRHYGRRARKIFLELSMLVPEGFRSGFRVEFGGVTISREFKPGICVGSDGLLLCKLVYDVTPIVESLSRRGSVDEMKLVVENFSMSAARLEHVGLLASYHRESNDIDVEFMSGMLALRPGEAYRAPLSSPARAEEIRVAAYAPQRGAVINVNGTPVKGSGFFEQAIRAGGVINAVEVSYEGSSNGPREVYVSSLLVVGGVAPKPSLGIEGIASEPGALIVNVVNRGGAEASNVIVVAMDKGVVRGRVIIPRIGAGESVSVKVPLSGPASHVRVIWRHLEKLMFVEARVSGR